MSFSKEHLSEFNNIFNIAIEYLDGLESTSNNLNIKACCMFQLSRCASENGDYKQASEYLKNIFHINCDWINNPYHRVQVLAELGSCFEAMTQYDLADEYLSRAIALENTPNDSIEITILKEGVNGLIIKKAFMAIEYLDNKGSLPEVKDIHLMNMIKSYVLRDFDKHSNPSTMVGSVSPKKLNKELNKLDDFQWRNLQKNFANIILDCKVLFILNCHQYAKLLIKQNFDGNQSKCVEFYDKAINISSSVLKSKFTAGLALKCDSNDIKKVVRDCYIGAGDIFCKKNELRKAIKYFSQARKFNPENTLVNNKIKSVIIKAIQLDPEYALHLSALLGEFELLKTAAKEVKDINCCGSDRKYTALHWAMFGKYNEETKCKIVEFLLSLEIDYNHKDYKDKKAVSYTNSDKIKDLIMQHEKRVQTYGMISRHQM